MTNYPVDQPNGGTGQNCAVINAKPGDATYIPSETQDKSCTTLSSTDMLCCNEGSPFFIMFDKSFVKVFFEI